jgi:hypothetical protein
MARGGARKMTHQAWSGRTTAASSSERRESGSRSEGIRVRWYSMPAAGMSRFSRPRLPPMKTKRQGLSVARASLTASRGLV